MNIIRAAIRNPVPVLVGVLLVVMFGAISLFEMPYQLSPNVTEPEISVRTAWPGATPYEIEREVIEEQEDVLKSIPGLVEMESTSRNDVGTITLTFKIGTPILEAMLRTSNSLDEVRSYPDGVEKPVVNDSGANTDPIVRVFLKPLPGNETSILHYRTFVDDELSPYLERLEGVSELQIFGGVEKEMHVIIDPDKMAAFGITISGITAALNRQNINVSAGDLDLGRRNYRLRTTGEFKSPEQVEQTVITAYGDRAIRVSDVAHVEQGYEEIDSSLTLNGEPGIHIGIVPQVGVNVLDLTNRAETVIEKLNNGLLKDKGLYLQWAYEQRPYILGAIQLVKQNILIGGVLAIIVLIVFLRSLSSTIVVGLAIPISIVGTFIFLNGLGRNLNVISLAGIAFSVGMLVDNAIVVLENIDRHRKQLGKSPFAAAYDGAREVWGAVLASTLTTVAVFLPVVFIQEEAGQLFKDIAIAITCAILLSLTVSVLVIPMLSDQVYTLRSNGKKQKPPKPRTPFTIKIGQRFAGFILSLTDLTLKNKLTRTLTAAVLVGISVLIAVTLFPKMEYLPQGNRNLIFSFLIPPPGLSYEERDQIGKDIWKQVEPYYQKEYKDGVPGVDKMFFVSTDFITLFGIISTQEQEVKELIPLMSGISNSFPGIYGVSVQRGIFASGLGEGRNVDVDISGSDMQQIANAAAQMFGSLRQKIPQAQVRPVPSFELLYPEIRFLPDAQRLKSVGLSTAELGVILDVLMDGRDIGDFKPEGEKTFDLVLKGANDEVRTPEALYQALVITPQGDMVPVSSLAKMERTTGLNQIRHLEMKRTNTLQVTPPSDMPVQVAIEEIQRKIIEPMRGSGALEGLEINLSGTADKLAKTWAVLQSNFLIALIITYLLMSALFGNFLYPLVIMFTVPMAAAGGLLGLKVVNLVIAPQPLDILTMLGFIMLIGVVVNNAILIVHQALNNIRDAGMEQMEAIKESVRTRIRPIFMSATTSISGMLPLVLAPGPGSELYRGLGSVIIGGLALSTVFTVFLIPVLLIGLVKMEKPNHAQEETDKERERRAA